MSKVISISEVNNHQNKNSVWMIIHNDVYDVTKFLEEHPGGEDALLDFAGKEATQAFEDVGHSEDARELLKKFKIGTLPDNERDKGVPPPVATSTCCPRIDEIMNSKDETKSWRDFDGPPRSARASKEQRVRIDPRPSNHIDHVVVPRERRSRGEPCGGANWKWYIIALLGAIVIGVIIKKKMGG